jgi:methionyl-tRNA synthetase
MIGLEVSGWNQAKETILLNENATIGEVELLFTKVEDETVAAQVNKLEETKKQNELNAWAPNPIKPNTNIDEFGKMDIRVGTVLECVKVPKADKLLQFLIDDGMNKRTIVSGIAKYYPNPEELVGKQVCFIANFEPRKLKGIVSEGMILSAEDKDGRLVVMSPSQPVAPGSSVG